MDERRTTRILSCDMRQIPQRRRNPSPLRRESAWPRGCVGVGGPRPRGPPLLEKSSSSPRLPAAEPSPHARERRRSPPLDLGYATSGDAMRVGADASRSAALRRSGASSLRLWFRASRPLAPAVPALDDANLRDVPLRVLVGGVSLADALGMSGSRIPASQVFEPVRQPGDRRSRRKRPAGRLARMLSRDHARQLD